jgi:hypothetical protein
LGEWGIFSVHPLPCADRGSGTVRQALIHRKCLVLLAAENITHCGADDVRRTLAAVLVFRHVETCPAALFDLLEAALKPLDCVNAILQPTAFLVAQ